MGGGVGGVGGGVFFFFNDTATTEIYTLSLHDALPILTVVDAAGIVRGRQYLLRLEVKHFSFIHHTVKPYHIARQ